jgi:hypothetical protein
LLARLSFQVVLGVCSHEHVSVLSVFCSALAYSAGSFTRLFQDVSHEPISSLSCFLFLLCYSAGSFTRLFRRLSALMSLSVLLFSALRLLQRWFFHQVVPCLFS